MDKRSSSENIQGVNVAHLNGSMASDRANISKKHFKMKENTRGFLSYKVNDKLV